MKQLSEKPFIQGTTTQWELLTGVLRLFLTWPPLSSHGTASQDVPGLREWFLSAGVPRCACGTIKAAGLRRKGESMCSEVLI